jgi:hypothetical protein
MKDQKQLSEEFQTHCLKLSYIPVPDFNGKTANQCIQILRDCGFKPPEDDYVNVKKVDSSVCIFGNHFIASYYPFLDGTLNIYSIEHKNQISDNGIFLPSKYMVKSKHGKFPPYHNPHGPARMHEEGEYYFLHGIPQKIISVRIKKILQ